jgi:hypothetical protein
MSGDYGFRVIDGDSIAYGGKQYRLTGYDAPEVRRLRTDKDKWTEWRRGEQAKLRLETLLAGARSVQLIDWQIAAPPGGRCEATLFIDGQDVRTIAINEGWGTPTDPNKKHKTTVDWGDPKQDFPDHLPIPDHVMAELSAKWLPADRLAAPDHPPPITRASQAPAATAATNT